MSSAAQRAELQSQIWKIAKISALSSEIDKNIEVIES